MAGARATERTPWGPGTNRTSGRTGARGRPSGPSWRAPCGSCGAAAGTRANASAGSAGRGLHRAGAARPADEAAGRRTTDAEADPNGAARGSAGLGGFAGHPDQAFGHITYARFGEDLIVAGLFLRLGVQRPTWLDVGARHPTEGSNTALLHARGGRGVNVAADPTLVEAFRRLRPADVTLDFGVGPMAGGPESVRADSRPDGDARDRAAAEAPPREHARPSPRDAPAAAVRTLDDVVREHCGGRWPDLLGLGGGGLDRAVLAAARFGPDLPTVVVVEAAGGGGGDASAGPRALLADRGFVVAFQTPGSLIAVRRAAAERLGIAAAVTELGRPAGAGAPAAPRAPAPPPPLPAAWAERIRVAAECRDADDLPRAEGAGGEVLRDGEAWQVMHPGVLVLRDGYHGAPMTELIRRLRGAHEPQEERCFAAVLPHLPRGAVMVELGCHWAYYSLWFHHAVPDAQCHMIEPDARALEVGIRNFARNGFRGIFTHAGVGEPDLAPWGVERRGRHLRTAPSGRIFFDRERAPPGLRRNVPLVGLAEYLADNAVGHVHVLHSDIQGAELRLLERCGGVLEDGRVDWLFVSTHVGDAFHRECLARVRALGLHVVAEHDVSGSYSGDGLIVAKRRGVAGPDAIPISIRRR